MKKAVRVIISGIVQGVFFRRFMKDHADKIGVNGFVRNLEDGSLEIFIEGDSEKVDEMITVAKQGPANSRLKKVEMREEKLQDFKDFKIL